MRTIAVLIFVLSMTACKTTQHAVSATPNKNGNLVGIAHKSDFEKAPYDTWFTKNYNSYSLDMETIQQIKPLLKNIKIKAVMGTWCGDSRRETPHFYKILEAAGFDLKNLTLITVDHDKLAPGNEQQGLGIERVPTFIFYKNGKEINRFVEYPRETLEKDILHILLENGYKHSYLD